MYKKLSSLAVVSLLISSCGNETDPNIEVRKTLVWHAGGVPPALEKDDCEAAKKESWGAEVLETCHVRYTNSLEALNHTYSKGGRIFELDIWLMDNETVPILTHGNGWDFYNIKTNEGFKSIKLFNRFTPMDGNDLIEWSKNKEVKFILDVKEPMLSQEMSDTYKFFKNKFTDTKHKIIPQIYKQSDLQYFLDFDFNEYWYTIYAEEQTIANDKSKIIEFVNKHKEITTLVAPSGHSTTFSDYSGDYDIVTHTVNDLDWYNNALSHGHVTSVMTDTLFM